MGDKEQAKLPINPGGPTGRNNVESVVIGRNVFVDDLMSTLETVSVEISAPRRIGKTWVLDLLRERGAKKADIFYFDLEGATNQYEFVNEIMKPLGSLLSRLGFAVGKVIEHVLQDYARITSYHLPWKEHLDSAFGKLNENHRPVWLLLDEYPTCLNNLIAAGKKDFAKEIVDFLRLLRQKYPNVKMVLAGSIGMHWVLEKLTEDGWRNPPNDIHKLSLGVLDERHAVFLAEGLLRTVNVDIAIADEMVIALNNHPFYIQAAIKKISLKTDEESARDYCLRVACLPEDPFFFNDLHDRLGAYFGKSRAGQAKRILDQLINDFPVAIAELSVNTGMQGEEILDVLHSLEKDGYVMKDQESKYYLWPDIFKDWWRTKRGGLYE